MENKRKDIMDSVQLRSEDPYPKHYFSPNYGKQKPWYTRAYKAAVRAVVGFVLDVIAAIKSIIKEVM